MSSWLMAPKSPPPQLPVVDRRLPGLPLQVRLADLDPAAEDLPEFRLVEVDGPLEDPVPLAALHEDAVELAGVEGASGFPAGGHFVVDGPSEAPRPVFERGIRPGVGPELFEDVLD